MKIAFLDKSQLVQCLALRTMPSYERLHDFNGLDISLIKKYEYCAIWDKIAQNEFQFTMPSCIVTSNQTKSDFLAWASTYLSFRPFTALCRIVDHNFLNKIEIKNSIPPREIIRAVQTSLILGEAVAQSYGTKRAMDLSVGACLSTLSFPLAQASLNYRRTEAGRGQLFDEVVNGWSLCRKIFKRDVPPLRAPRIQRIWNIVLNGLIQDQQDNPSDHRLTEIVYKYVNEETLSERDFGVEVRKRWSLSALWDSLNGPREIRVATIREFYESLRQSGETSEMYSVLVGYLNSRIDPGSLSHFEILRPLARTLPECFVWYSFFAGARLKNSVDDAFEGLGWWIRRELTKTSTWIARPDADISLSELLVLNRDSNSAVSFRTKNNTIAEIEIAPFVRTFASLRTSNPNEKKSHSMDYNEQSDLFERKNAEVMDTPALTVEFRKVAQRMEYLTEQLATRLRK